MKLHLPPKVFWVIVFAVIPCILIAQKPLFIKTNKQGSMPSKVDSLYLQKINIDFDVKMLQENNNDKLEIFLPGVTGHVVVNKTKQSVNKKFGSFSWYGSIQNQPESFVSFTVVKNSVSGYIRTASNKVYQIFNIGNDVHQIAEVNLKIYQPDNVNYPQALLDNSIRHETLQVINQACCDTVIDVLVVYTQIAKNNAGGENGILAIVLQCVDITNESFLKSGVKAKINLANAIEVNYADEGYVIQDLDRLTDTGDGYLDNVQALRNDNNADIVALLIGQRKTSDLGWAHVLKDRIPSYADSAFCVVDYAASVSRLIFPHEIGHILGAGHQCEGGRSGRLGLFNESHCYSTSSFRTIMSIQSDIPQIEQWSNPAVRYPTMGGVPTGDLSAACPSNNAATIDSALAFVSLYRCQENCASTPRIRTITTAAKSSSEVISTNEKSDEQVPDNKTFKKGWSIGIGMVLLLAFIIYLIAKRKRKQKNGTVN